ncbi:hypothetical protein G3T14_09220 [Methylobacterium sp. BTF04]|uniref:hypothetical protein n=1 Tax=Methylobacterium sp. BTF04 TaxID=2708300 RepID=UPI0013D41621|nr:hypothetical protein [Methylobacterium sp. BTF04]NEU12313.1 hypothetical protein [Methylobacterium sp. BTF04]
MSDVIWDSETKRDDLSRLYKIIFSKIPHAEKIDSLNELSRIATEGSLAAAIYIASYYDAGKKVEFKGAALRWLKIAASMGSRAAAFRMAVAQIESTTDRNEAECSLRKLSEAGYLPAKFRLASYLYLRNPKANKTECLNLLRSASAGGHVFAKRELGRITMISPARPLDVFIGFSIILSSIISFLPILIKLAKGDNSSDEKLYG